MTDDFIAFVFHLTEANAERSCASLLQRFAYDSRITVEDGDVWTREATTGKVTHHRVEHVRVFEGVQGKELHVFTAPSNNLLLEYSR